MPTVMERLSLEDRKKVNALAEVEEIIKSRTSAEVWALIECIRQHPEITGPLPIHAIDEAHDPNLKLFTHFVKHCRRVVESVDASRVTSEAFAEIVSPAIKAMVAEGEARHDA